MKIIILYFFSTIACLFFSCNQPVTNKISIAKKETYKQKFGIEPNETITPTKVASFENNTFYYFLNWDKQKIYGYEIETNKLINEIDISAVGNIISLSRITQFQWINKEIIGIFSNDDQKIILIDTTGKILDQAITSDEKTAAPYVSVSYFDRTFAYNRGKIYFNIAYTDFTLAEKKDYKKYYSRPTTLSISLSDSTKSCFLKAPYSYQEGNAYEDFDVFNCVGENNQLLFSFPANDSLFVCKDDNLLKKVFAGSNQEHKFLPYDVSKNKNLSLIRKYNLTKPFYQKIVYDSYRNLFFRVFKLKNTYLDDKGEIKRNYTWSLVVLNNKFNVLGELQFDSKNYSPATIVPTKKGLIISGKIDKGVVKDYTIFDVIINSK